MISERVDLIKLPYLTLHIRKVKPKQRVQTQIRCHRMQCLTRVYTVFHLAILHTFIASKMDLLKRSMLKSKRCDYLG